MENNELEYFIGIEGSLGEILSPRKLSAYLIGSIVLIEGIVTKCMFYLF